MKDTRLRSPYVGDARASSSQSPTTLWDSLDRNALEIPKAIGFVDAPSGRRYSWEEISAIVERRARAMATHSLAGATAVLLGDRSVEMVLWLLAGSRVGATILPILRPGYADVVLPAFREAFHIDAFVVADVRSQPSDFAKREERVITTAELDATTDVPSRRPEPGEILYVNHTTGSTGTPKFVIASHAKVVANGLGLIEAFELGRDLVFMSLFVAHQHDLFHRAVLAGGTAVLIPGCPGDPTQAVEAILRYGVNLVRVTPPMAQAISDGIGGQQLETRLELLEVGGGPIEGPLRERMEHQFGCRVLPVWGSTETTGVAIANRPGEPIQGVGRPIPGYEVSVLAPDGGHKNAGELVVSGAAVADGYAGRIDARLAAGTYRTGDAARYAGGGTIEIVGRTGTAFKVAAVHVHPEVAEAALVRQTAIRAAIVLPARASLSLEDTFPLALVEVEGRPSTSEIQRAVLKAAAQLRSPSHECPRWVLVVEDLPIRGGKVNRRLASELIGETGLAPPEALPVRPSLIRRVSWLLRELPRHERHLHRILRRPWRAIRIIRGQLDCFWGVAR